MAVTVAEQQPAGRAGPRARPRLKVGRSFVTGVVTVVVLLVLWWLATSGLGLVSPARFPSPEAFLAALRRIWTDGYAGGTLIEHVVQSVRLVLIGFITAVCIGVPLGFLMGYDRRIEAFVNPIFLVLRPIPPLAWIPLAIVWFSLGDASKVFVIFVSAFVPSVINTYTGVRNVRRHLIEAALVHGATPARVVREVYLPDASPMIFTGLRLSLQASWTTLVAAELVGAFLGLGRALQTAYRDVNTPMILVAMVAIAIAGAATTIGLTRLEKRLIRWREER